MKFACFLLLLLPFALQANFHPWGKDAQLAIRSKSVCVPPPSSDTPTFLTKIADRCIDFHHDVISPCDGPRSHFTPSSSYYTQEAMRKYGFIQGVFLGCDRLMRENNQTWIYTTALNREGILRKYDPVP